MKKFANLKKSRTFVSGMRKQGSLDGIILVVISFSVITYVVSRASACEGRRFFFYARLPGIKKEKVSPRASRCPRGGYWGKIPRLPPVCLTSGPPNFHRRCLYGSNRWTCAGNIGHFCLYRSINWTCTSTRSYRRRWLFRGRWWCGRSSCFSDCEREGRCVPGGMTACV